MGQKILHNKGNSVNKTKRWPTEQEKIFANDISNKRFIFSIYKQFIQLNILKMLIEKSGQKGQSQDGRGIGWGDHFLPDKFIKR